MCDDCLDAAYEQVDEKERENEKLRDDVSEWQREYRRAESALLEMNQLVVDAPYQHDETWVVPADSIAEVFERWVNGDE